MPTPEFTEMLHELDRGAIVRFVTHKIKVILKDRGVIGSHSAVKSGISNRGSPMEFYFLWVDEKDNVFGKKIEIVIRPDSTRARRALSVVLQIGTEVFRRNEDGSASKHAFKKAILRVLRDIEIFVRKEKRSL